MTENKYNKKILNKSITASQITQISNFSFEDSPETQKIIDVWDHLGIE